MSINKLIERARSEIKGILDDLESDIESLIEEEKRNSFNEGYGEAEQEQKKRES